MFFTIDLCDFLAVDVAASVRERARIEGTSEIAVLEMAWRDYCALMVHQEAATVSASRVVSGTAPARQPHTETVAPTLRDVAIDILAHGGWR